MQPERKFITIVDTKGAELAVQPSELSEVQNELEEIFIQSVAGLQLNDTEYAALHDLFVSGDFSKAAFVQAVLAANAESTDSFKTPELLGIVFDNWYAALCTLFEEVDSEYDGAYEIDYYFAEQEAEAEARSLEQLFVSQYRSQLNSLKLSGKHADLVSALFMAELYSIDVLHSILNIDLEEDEPISREIAVQFMSEWVEAMREYTGTEMSEAECLDELGRVATSYLESAWFAERKITAAKSQLKELLYTRLDSQSDFETYRTNLVEYVLLSADSILDDPQTDASIPEIVITILNEVEADPLRTYIQEYDDERVVRTAVVESILHRYNKRGFMRMKWFERVLQQWIEDKAAASAE